MRVLLAAATALLAQASAAAPQAAADPVIAPLADAAGAADKCRRPTSHQAQSGSAWRNGPIGPRKLTELPPAIAYMAVYRTIDGCEVPMTVVEYRTGRRP